MLCLIQIFARVVIMISCKCLKLYLYFFFLIDSAAPVKSTPKEKQRKQEREGKITQFLEDVARLKMLSCKSHFILIPYAKFKPVFTTFT